MHKWKLFRGLAVLMGLATLALTGGAMHEQPAAAQDDCLIDPRGETEQSVPAVTGEAVGCALLGQAGDVVTITVGGFSNFDFVDDVTAWFDNQTPFSYEGLTVTLPESRVYGITATPDFGVEYDEGGYEIPNAGSVYFSVTLLSEGAPVESDPASNPDPLANPTGMTGDPPTYEAPVRVYESLSYMNTGDAALPFSAATRDVCAGGDVQVTVSVDEIWVRDPEEADTNSFVGGDETEFYFGIATGSPADPDFGTQGTVQRLFDFYTDSRLTDVASLTRTLNCDDTGYVYFGLWEGDTLFLATTYTELGAPLWIPLVSERNPDALFTPRAEAIFAGVATDGSYDYRLYFTVTLNGQSPVAAATPADGEETPAGDGEAVLALVPAEALPLEAGTVESPGNFDYLLTRDQDLPPTALILRAGEIYTIAFTVNDADGAVYYTTTDAETGEPVFGAMTILLPDMAEEREFDRITVEKDAVWVYDFYLDDSIATAANFTLLFWREGRVADYMLELGVPLTLDAPDNSAGFGATFPHYFMADGLSAYTVSASDVNGAPLQGLSPVVICGPNEFYSPSGPESTLTVTPSAGLCEVRLNANFGPPLPAQVQLVVTGDGAPPSESGAVLPGSGGAIPGGPPPDQPAAADSDLIRQWASRADATSQYGTERWSAMQATGAPNTDRCGDMPTAWASLNGQGQDRLTLYFETPVRATAVHIYQTYNPGAIIGVELVPADGGAPVVVRNSADPGTECPGVFSLNVADVDAGLVNGVTLVLDQTLTGNWNEIDAVELVGRAVEEAEATPDVAVAARPTPTATPTLRPSPTATFTPRPSATPTRTPTRAPTHTATPFNCPGVSVPPQLVAGGQGIITPGDPNLINSKPARGSLDSSSQRLGRIEAGQIFNVISGPVCNHEIIWWEVEFRGIRGWTGEANGSTYWAVPYP